MKNLGLRMGLEFSLAVVLNIVLSSPTTRLASRSMAERLIEEYGIRSDFRRTSPRGKPYAPLPSIFAVAAPSP